MKSRILLIDDSTDILLLMTTELEWSGYVVDAAESGQIGLEFLHRNRADVIVSDIQMPGMDGFEFIRRVRAIPEFAKIPAIALSGYDQDSHIREELAAGFTAHATKPVDAADLIHLIQQLDPRCCQAA
jgi:two-component system CheB/CheR fusion protein